MTLVLALMLALVLPAALVYLTLSANDFEKNTRALAAVLEKRYQPEPPRKSALPGAAAPAGAAVPGREAGKPGRP
jgi:hypothetical protein